MSPVAEPKPHRPSHFQERDRTHCVSHGIGNLCEKHVASSHADNNREHPICQLERVGPWIHGAKYDSADSVEQARCGYMSEHFMTPLSNSKESPTEPWFLQLSIPKLLDRM